MDDPFAAPPVAYPQRDLFGGTGEVMVVDLLGQTPIAPFQAALACELAPGGRVGDHVQESYPEIVIITSGDALISVDGMARRLGPGGLVALSLGRVLAIANASATAPLTYIIIKAG